MAGLALPAQRTFQQTGRQCPGVIAAAGLLPQLCKANAIGRAQQLQREKTTMAEWLLDNSGIINAASSVAMLAVWVVYLQVFRHGYQRQSRAKIVINRAVGRTLDAHCFISNMSWHAIYLEAVIVTIECENYRVSQGVTDLDTAHDQRPADPRRETHKGPLDSGDQTSIGTFRGLIERTAESRGEAVSDLTSSDKSFTVKVMVIADYLSEDLVVGAKRAFIAEKDGETWRVRPDTVQTVQVRSRRQRRAIRQLVADDAEQAG